MNNKGMMGVVLFAIIIAAFLIFLMFVAINTTNNSIEKFCITNGYTSARFIDDGYRSKQYFCIDENRITRIINGLDGKYYLMKEESE
jgi:hypothetical protein